MHLLKEKQYDAGKDTDYGCKKDFAECGGIVYYFTRWVQACVLQACSQDQLVTLIHEGELTDKLKGCMRPSGQGGLTTTWGPQPAVWKLTEVWTAKARGLSRELYKQIEGEPSQQEGKRQGFQAASSLARGRREAETTRHLYQCVMLHDQALMC